MKIVVASLTEIIAWRFIEFTLNSELMKNGTNLVEFTEWQEFWDFSILIGAFSQFVPLEIHRFSLDILWFWIKCKSETRTIPSRAESGIIKSLLKNYARTFGAKRTDLSIKPPTQLYKRLKTKDY